VCVVTLTSSPLEATSVAMRILRELFLNFSMALSLSCWVLSPCRESQAYPSLQVMQRKWGGYIGGHDDDE
jgi:hypothetical protein